ncbi:MAG: recombinase family protein [Pseudomonadota bacterium]
MIIGYARVSTTDQNLDAQTYALTAAGAERLFSETVSGAKVERPELNKVWDHFFVVSHGSQGTYHCFSR